jgi:hypothetical protein
MGLERLAGPEAVLEGLIALASTFKQHQQELLFFSKDT